MIDEPEDLREGKSRTIIWPIGWLLAPVLRLVRAWWPRIWCLALLCACGDEQANAADLLFSESFESQSATTWTAYPDSRHYTPNTAQSLYVTTQAHEGSYSANYYALSGTNERTPVMFYADPTDFNEITGTSDGTTEIYFQWHDYFTSTYPFPSSQQKLFRIGYDNVSFPAEKKEITVGIQTSNADVDLGYFCGQWGDSSACNVGAALHTNQPIATNQWVKLAIWIKLNTPGSSDGFIRFYIDDVLAMEGTSLNLRGTNTKGFNFLWLGGNYSMLSGGTLSGNGNRYIDDVKWYDSQPDAAPDPSPSPSPSASASPSPSPSPSATPTPSPAPAYMPYLQ